MTSPQSNSTILGPLIPSESALTVQYASPNSLGANAQSIGWIDFGTGFTLSNNAPSTSIVNLIPGGYQIRFSISLSATTTGPFANDIAIISSSTPTFEKAAFGNTGYTGIGGSTALIQNQNYPIGQPIRATITLSNIQVTNACGVPVSNYTLYAADAETTTVNSSGFTELWSVTSNSSPWQLTAIIPSIDQTVTGPTISGLNTLTITETGATSVLSQTDAGVFSTNNPSQINALYTTDGGRQSFAFGIMIAPTRPPQLEQVPPVCLCQQKVVYVNAVTANSQQQYCVDSPTTQTIISFKYGNTTYFLSNNTVTINGSLGTYTFSDKQIQLKQNTGVLPLTTDLFLVTFQQKNSVCTYYVPFTLQPCTCI